MLFSKRDPYRPLKRMIGKEKVLDRPEDLAVYAIDASYTIPPGDHNPEIVVLAESAEDVVEAVLFARTMGMSVVARGTGTGMSAGAVPLSGGMVISTEKMRAITGMNVDEKWINVQPGLTTEEVKNAAAEHNLAYPPDPSSYKISSIGGNIAENAGGLRCVKYGTTSDYVRGLRFVNAVGEIISTGSLAESPLPLDLTPMLVGSEGLLGIVVEAQLGLIPAPKSTYTILAHFVSQDQALRTVAAILPELLPSVCEFMDGKVIEAVKGHDPYPFPESTAAALLLETDGDPETARLEADRIMEILEEFEPLEVHTASSCEERERVWNLRRLISPSLARLASGKMNEDVVVPLGSMMELLQRVWRVAEDLNLMIPVYGHAGDGNLHLNIMYDKGTQAEIQRAHAAVEKCFEIVIDLGGSISGEHGIGASKNRYLKMQLTDEELELLKSIKQALDPDNLFNPHKLFPPQMASSLKT